MILLRRVIVVAMTAALGGCVLLVDSFETTDHCGIQGGGECAQCIRKSCQVPIDRCCANSACETSKVLGAVDACGRGEIGPCADILAAPRLVTAEEEVRSCVASSCRQVCTQGSTGTGRIDRPKWTCTTSRDTTTDCATCIYQQCSSSIETCCTETTCSNDSTIQTDMAACVSGDAPGCAYSADAERGTTGQAGILRRCIKEECGTRCLGNGLPHTECEVYAQGDYCQCKNAEVAGTETCRKDTVQGDCVLGTRGCTCGQYACTDDSLGCACEFTGGVVGSSCSAPSGSGKVCCIEQDGYGIKCSCRFSSCSTSLGEQEIPSCDRADVIDRLGGAAVDSCSR